MKIKTIEKLQDKLDEDLAWRKKELFDFNQIVCSDSERESIFVRAGIAVLCAHFEGFIKLAANYYVVYVSDKNIPVNDIKNNFLALKFRKKIHECSKTPKASVHTTFFDVIDKMQGGYFSVHYSDDDKIISTGGNPTSENIVEILQSIGLDFSRFESKKKYIDHNLLKNRNEIVHGERTYLSKEDFHETYRIIMEVMEDFKSMIINAAEEGLYLKCKIG